MTTVASALDPETAQQGDRSSRPARYSTITAVLTIAGVGGALMQTVIIPVQSQLPRLLDASPADTPWAVTAALISGAICTPIAGRLGDMYGKRRIALWLLAIQFAGCLLAALATTLPVLVAARSLQGVTLGLVPLGVAILRDVLPGERLPTGIAVVSTTVGVGAALGVPLSAFVATVLDWRALFWVTAGIALVVFTLICVFVPASTIRTRGRVDIPGIVGLALGLIGILIAVSRGSQWGWTDPRVLGLLIGGVVVLVIWAVYELRARNPLVNLRVNSRPIVLLTNLASIAVGFALFISNVIFPQLIEMPVATGIGLGMPLLIAGLVQTPLGLMMMASAPLSGFLGRRVGAKWVLLLGAVMICVGWGVALPFHSVWWTIALVNFLLGIGCGLAFAAMPMLITYAVPITETAAANGLNTLTRALGNSFAAAVIGVVLAQSVVTVGGITAPGESGFVVSMLLGLISAVIASLISAFIPTRRMPRT